MRTDPTKTHKEATYQVVLDTLALSPCYNAFLITADVLEIYMQQFWFTISMIKDSSLYKFKLDNKSYKENMPYPRFTKAIIQYFISKEKSISMRNRMFMHSIKNDSVLVTLKFVPKDLSAYSTGSAKPNKARKWKQPTSAPKKNTSFTADDNITFDDLDAALELAKSISKKEAKKQETTRLVHKTHEHMVTKESIGRRRQTGVTIGDIPNRFPNEPKGKSIGTSEGAGSKPEVPNVSKAMLLDQQSENKSWGKSKDDDDDCKSDDERTKTDDDESIDLNKIDDEEETQEDEFVHKPDDYVPTDDKTHDVDDEEYVVINEELYNDVNVEIKDVEPANEGKGDEEMIDTEKLDAEHEDNNQDISSAKVQDKV
nr:hypothetical protein [Tanacetum cinerariifolium]